MKIWPISVIAQSPLLPAVYANEIYNIYNRMPSEGAFYACVDVARRTQSVDAPGLVIVESAGGGPNMPAYTHYPSDREWERLERCAVMQSCVDGYMFVLMSRLQ